MMKETERIKIFGSTKFRLLQVYEVKTAMKIVIKLGKRSDLFQSIDLKV